jgi:hypothetical protein
MAERPAVRIRSIPRAVMGSLVAVLVVSGGVAIAATSVRARPQLPSVTTTRLIASMIRTADRPPSITGTAVAHVDLGLPSLPQQGGTAGGVAGLLAELTGDHRVRVWSSIDGVRVDELLPGAERAVYVGADGGWVWSSGSFTAYRLFGANDVAAAQRAAAAREAERSRLMQMVDPIALADQALAAVSPTTAVAVGSPTRVAGRAAYTLVLRPRDAQTLVGHVDIAVDAMRRVPLRVELFADGAATAAASVGFESVSFDPIDADVYRFTPPAGAKVVMVKRPYRMPWSQAGLGDWGDAGDMQTFGDGWSTVVAVRVPASQMAHAGAASGIDLGRFLPYSGPLFSVRSVTRGDHVWLLAGAVPQFTLARMEPRLR